MTDADRIQRLHEIAAPQDKAEITILHNAVLERMRAYQSASTAAHLKDWQAAKAALAEALGRMWPRYFPAEPAEVTVFDQQIQAREWLRKQGFKVSAGKFSQDCRAGLCVLQSDKTIRLQDLKAYASTLSVDHHRAEGASQRQDQKDAFELRILAAKADREERNNLRDKGVLIDRAEAEMALARKLVVVYGRVRAQFRRDQDAMLRALGLPPAKASALLIEAVGCLDRAFNAMRDHRVFDVMISEDDHADG